MSNDPQNLPALRGSGMNRNTPGTDPVGEIGPQPWMQAPETVAVIRALTAEGGDVRFVGGCVRDSFARRPIGDIDLATPMKPETVIALLEKAGLRAIPTGIEHGTVTALSGDRHYEITTLRVDVETDGRHAKVAFTDDWIADAARRDFTINAMSCSVDGAIYDPFNGLDDLGHGRVRFVGIARERIAEDVLRLLRFFRVYATYGAPPADIDALAACRAMASELPKLSGERVRAELLRILLAPNADEAIVMMRGQGVFDHLLPQATNIGRLRMMAWLDSRAIRLSNISPEPIRRLAALLDTNRAGAEAIAERLRLSVAEREHLVALAEPSTDIAPGIPDAAFRRLLHKVGAERVRDQALMLWAQRLSIAPHLPREDSHAWQQLLSQTASWQSIEFPLKGRDVLAAGIAPGPDVGEILARAETWWADGDFRADRDACLAYLRMLIAARG